MRALLVFFTCATTVFAQERWSINPDHSSILFKVPFLQVSHVSGRFQQFEGYLEFAQERPQALSLKIQAASIDTANRQRDQHLRSTDFLKAQGHPLIIYRSQKIDEISPQQFRAHGHLSLAGKTLPFNLDFSLSPVLWDTWQYASRFARLETSLSRKMFGIQWNKVLPNSKFLIGDRIQVFAEIQLQLSPTPASKHLIPDTPFIRAKDRGETPETNTFEETFSPLIPIPQQSLPAPRIDPTSLIKEEIACDPQSKPWSWWLAYLVLALWGFGATIILIFKGKECFMRKLGDRYQESGTWGILSDLIFYPFGLAFAWALWVVAFN